MPITLIYAILICMKLIAYCFLLSISILTTGCASLPGQIEPPTLSIADINLVNVTLLEQKFRIQLRIQNPNSFDLPIDGLAYELEINDKPFAKGLSNHPVTVPRYGSELLEVEGVSTLAGLFRQLAELEKNHQSNLRYRIKGKLNLSNVSSPIPFDTQGDIDLSSKGMGL